MGDFQIKAGAELELASAEVVAAKERFAELAAYVNGAANAGVADPQVCCLLAPAKYTHRR